MPPKAKKALGIFINQKEKKDMRKIVLFIIGMLALASCNDKKAQKQDDGNIQQDSLRLVLEQRSNELDDMLATFNQIEEGLKEIAEAEGRVSVAKDGEGANQKERIQENMQFIQQTMKQNKELIAKLRKQLKESSIQSDELKKTIENLTVQLEEKEKEIQELRAELDSKNIHIAELDEQIEGLNSDVSALTEESKEKSATISSQDKQLNTAWYAFGTKSELKEQNILVSKKVLQANFNQDYFTKIDIRVDKEIKLYSRSAEILTNHPEGSYTLQQDAQKQYVLRITDPQQFWSTSKYLVIQVK